MTYREMYEAMEQIESGTTTAEESRTLLRRMDETLREYVKTKPTQEWDQTHVHMLSVFSRSIALRGNSISPAAGFHVIHTPPHPDTVEGG